MCLHFICSSSGFVPFLFTSFFFAKLSNQKFSLHRFALFYDAMYRSFFIFFLSFAVTFRVILKSSSSFLVVIIAVVIIIIIDIVAECTIKALLLRRKERECFELCIELFFFLRSCEVHWPECIIPCVRNPCIASSSFFCSCRRLHLLLYDFYPNLVAWCLASKCACEYKT